MQFRCFKYLFPLCSLTFCLVYNVLLWVKVFYFNGLTLILFLHMVVAILNLCLRNFYLIHKDILICFFYSLYSVTFYFGIFDLSWTQLCDSNLLYFKDESVSQYHLHKISPFLVPLSYLKSPVHNWVCFWALLSTHLLFVPISISHWFYYHGLIKDYFQNLNIA